MKLRQWFVGTLAVLVGAGCLLAAPARAANTGVAVLVVGRSSDPALARYEHVIVDGLTRARAQRGWTHQALPIYSYHFDKNVERTYCEQRLQVKPADLVVVGLVELQSGVPVRFIERQNDVTSAAQVAARIMDRAQDEMAARGILPVSTRPAPPVSTRPAPPVVKPVTVRPASHPASHPTVPVMAAKPRRPATQPPVMNRPAPPATVATRPAEPWEAQTAPPAPPPLQYDARGGIVIGPPAGTETMPFNANQRWTVQVGLFESLQKARALAHGLKVRGNRVEIRKGRHGTMAVYRVLTGLFHSKADANSRARALQGNGIAAFSVRLDQMLGTVIP